MKSLFSKVFFYLYLIGNTKWFSIIKRYSSNSNNIILLWPSYPNNFKEYLLGGAIERDFALINYAVLNLDSIRFVWGTNKVLNIKNANVYYSLGRLYRHIPGHHYAESLHNFIDSLLSNGNNVFPPKSEILYWENKLYMHQMFDEKNISSPKTVTFQKGVPTKNYDHLTFPILYKPAHASGSVGIEKWSNQADFNEKISDKKDDFLLQEWIDMRSDLRLIYIGNELVVHYWRINNKSEWVPTSTGHGSSVDFESLPKQWMSFLFDEYKKLELCAAAFDITWKNDNLSNKPQILEVSPSFMPNPSPKGIYKTMPYKKFKESMIGENSYNKQYVLLLFKCVEKMYKLYTAKNNQ